MISTSELIIIKAEKKLAFKLYNEGYYQASLNSLKKIEAYYIEDIDFCWKLAELNEKCNDYREAELWIEKGLQLSPRDFRLLLLRSRLLYQQKNYHQAVICLQSLISQNIEPFFQADVLFELGRNFDKLDQNQQAYSSFQQANTICAAESIKKEIFKNDYLNIITEYSEITVDLNPLNNYIINDSYGSVANND